MSRFGIDVSLWQKGFNFAKAKEEGVEFAIIKCSESGFKDPEFENHYAAAKAAGIHVGAYHFCTATTAEEARAQAKTCLAALTGKQLEYPVFIDFENSNSVNYRSFGKDHNTAVIRAFCEAVETAGYWAGIYISHDFYENAVHGEVLGKRFSLWLASWGKNVPAPCQMWQFGGETNMLRSNKVAGVVCDQNYCYVDYPTSIIGEGLNGFGKSVAPAPAKDIEQAVRDVLAGKYGDYPERKTRLEAAGYSYAEVQAAVDAYYKQNDGSDGIAVGDAVRMSADAPVYGTSGKFDLWVYGAKLYVRDIDGDRVVVSTQTAGAVTGAVERRYLTKA